MNEILDSLAGDVPCLAHMEAPNSDQSFRIQMKEKGTWGVATLPTIYNDSKFVKY